MSQGAAKGFLESSLWYLLQHFCFRHNLDVIIRKHFVWIPANVNLTCLGTVLCFVCPASGIYRRCFIMGLKRTGKKEQNMKSVALTAVDRQRKSSFATRAGTKPCPGLLPRILDDEPHRCNLSKCQSRNLTCIEWQHPLSLKKQKTHYQIRSEGVKR